MTSVQTLMRPDQISDTKEEISRLEHAIQQPDLQDRPLALRQIKSLQTSLEAETPIPFNDADVDLAVRAERDLREDMVADGMPTRAEMRRCPPGAVAKHQHWEARNKEKIRQWKYIRRRLNIGSPDRDIANFEQYRPTGGASELNMDGALIKGKDIFLPSPNAGPVVVMNEAEAEVLKKLEPEIYEQMAVLSNEQRSKVLEFVQGMMAGDAEVMVEKEIPVEVAVSAKSAKPKRTLTPEQRAAAGKRMAEGRKKAAAKRAADAEVAALTETKDK